MSRQPGFTKKQFYDLDWSATKLGPIADWALELRQIASLILDSEQPMFLLWGPERLFLFNPAFAAILGDDFWSAFGAPIDKLWADAWEDLQPYVEATYRGRAILAEQVPFKTWASQYQETKYFTFSASPVRNRDDEVVGGFCIVRDTTELVSEAKELRSERDMLQSLFEQAPVFLALGSKDLRFVYANSAYKQFVGRDELVGAKVAEALPEADAQGFVQLLKQVLESGVPYVAHNAPYERGGPLGTETRYIDFIYQPTFAADGSVDGILCVGSDVTEQHRAQQTSKLLQAKVSQSARLNAMGAIATTLAHEINQPLTAAINYLSGGRRVLERLAGPDSDLVRDAFAEARAQMERAGEIIKKARELISRGRPVTQSVRLSEIVQPAVHSARASLSLSDEVEVETTFSDDPLVEVDPVQIEQVLVNLFRNASTAMGHVGTISISCAAKAEVVELQVRDTGPGLSETVIDSLFAPFVDSPEGGMGIGLSICRTLVESHHGRIAATNHEGGGAIFKIELPAVADSQLEPASEAPR